MRLADNLEGSRLTAGRSPGLKILSPEFTLHESISLFCSRPNAQDVFLLLWRGVELQQIAIGIKEVKTSSRGPFDCRDAVDPDSPILHLPGRKLKVFGRDRKGVVGGAVLLQGVFLDWRGTLEEHDHRVSGSKIRPVQMISHVVPVELRDFHAQNLGVELHRALDVIDWNADMVNSCRRNDKPSLRIALATFA